MGSYKVVVSLLGGVGRAMYADMPPFNKEGGGGGGGAGETRPVLCLHLRSVKCALLFAIV